MSKQEQIGKTLGNPCEYRALRKAMGTQAEVAAMLEAARETIARRETGKDRITREAALALYGLSKLPKKERLKNEG